MLHAGNFKRRRYLSLKKGMSLDHGMVILKTRILFAEKQKALAT